MVSLTIAAADQPVTVNGVELAGPVALTGDIINVLGQTLDSGSWVVGLDSLGNPELVQLAGATWWQADLVWPLVIVLGMLAALRGLRIA